MESTRINEAFEGWLKDYVHKNDYDPYIYTMEQMKDSWNASRIDTLKRVKAIRQHAIDVGGKADIIVFIDTELKKGE